MEVGFELLVALRTALVLEKGRAKRAGYVEGLNEREKLRRAAREAIAELEGLNWRTGGKTGGGKRARLVTDHTRLRMDVGKLLVGGAQRGKWLSALRQATVAWLERLPRSFVAGVLGREGNKVQDQELLKMGIFKTHIDYVFSSLLDGRDFGGFADFLAVVVDGVGECLDPALQKPGDQGNGGKKPKHKQCNADGWVRHTE